MSNSNARYAMQSEIRYLIGDFTSPLDVSQKLDALNRGITYRFRRDSLGGVIGIDVDYLSFPQVFRDDLLAIGVTHKHLAN